jgi:DNA-binding transcriptional LysR family regulator
MTPLPALSTQLDAFRLIVQHGGISNAARASGQSKSNLSGQLGSLEQQINTRLCHRTPFSLTRHGRQMSLIESGLRTAHGEELSLPGERVVEGLPDGFGAVLFHFQRSRACPSP